MRNVFHIRVAKALDGVSDVERGRNNLVIQHTRETMLIILFQDRPLSLSLSDLFGSLKRLGGTSKLSQQQDVCSPISSRRKAYYYIVSDGRMNK